MSGAGKAGEWFFPDGGMVPQLRETGDTITAATFYKNRGDDGSVNLNRLNNDVMMPTGRFCCVVSDATSVSQWACAVICELIAIIKLIMS